MTRASHAPETRPAPIPPVRVLPACGRPIRRRAGRSFGWFVAAALAGAFAILAGGCYERVVRADGFGASGFNVQPAYRSETALDRGVDRLMGNHRRRTSTRAMEIPEVPNATPPRGR